MGVFLYLFLIPFLALWLPVTLLTRWTKRFGLLFFLALYSLYLVWVPVTDRLAGIQSFFGFQLPWNPELDREISFVYGLGVLAFWLGYGSWEWGLSGTLVSGAESRKRNPDRIFQILLYVQVVAWILVFFNVHASGISLTEVLNPFNREEQNILFSADWKYPRLDLLANLIPVCLFLQWYFRPRFSALWLGLFLVWFGFGLLGGWRYRIILFVLFMGLGHLDRHSFGLRKWLPYAFVLIPVFAWLTLNRMALAKRQFQHITFDLRQFDLSVLNTEFSNSRTFRATWFWMKGHHISSPGFSEWLDFVGQRLTGNRRPGGSAWILETTKAWIPPGWPWNPNPAVSQLEEFFLTFGYGGLAISMFLIGLWVRMLDGKPRDAVWNAARLVGIGLLFQWISRGFFLFQLQISLVCLIPFVVLWMLGPYLSDERNADPA